MGTTTLIRPIDYAPIVRRPFRRTWLAATVLSLSDGISISLVYWLAVWVHHFNRSGMNMRFYVGAYPLLLLFIGTYFLWGLYPGLLLHAAEETKRIAHATTGVCLLCLSLSFLTKSSDHYSRFVFLAVWLGGSAAVIISRHTVRSLTGRASFWRIPAVVFGSGPAAQRVARELQQSKVGLHVTGVLTDEPDLDWDDSLPPVLGDFSTASLVLSIGAARYAVVVMPERSDADVTAIIQRHCRGFRHVLLVPDLPAIVGVGVSSRNLGDGEVGLEMEQHLSFFRYRICKRLIDLVAGTAIILAISPLLLCIALLVKLTSRGPLFFGHARYGKDGSRFRLWKFRTMVTNGDQVLKDYLERHPEAMLEWTADRKLRNDPRVTWLGRTLRRFSLDELPQLINVVSGNMSLVGPRPIVREEIARYADCYDLYMRVAPGMTGLWQVSGRNSTSYEQRVAFDRFYVRTWSVWLDLYILLRTIRAVLIAEGAY